MYSQTKYYEIASTLKRGRSAIKLKNSPVFARLTNIMCISYTYIGGYAKSVTSYRRCLKGTRPKGFRSYIRVWCILLHTYIRTSIHRTCTLAWPVSRSRTYRRTGRVRETAERLHTMPLVGFASSPTKNSNSNFYIRY